MSMGGRCRRWYHLSHASMTTIASAGARSGTGVLVLGAGGLGCPAIAHLAAVGVARIGVAEFDVVEESNLPRQLLYRFADIGRSKLDVVRERMEAVPGRSAFDLRLHPGIARGDESWIDEYGVVIDAVDAAEQKFALHDAIVSRGIPLVHAGASGWEAQVLTVRGPGCLRCLFGTQSGEAPDCRRAGVLGPLVGLAGILAAADAVRVLEGRAPRHLGRLWSIDASAGRVREVPVAPDPACPICSGSASPQRE